MGFDPLPVVCSLKHMIPGFRNLELNHSKPSIVSQRQQVDGTNAGHTAPRSSELRMQRRDNQPRIQASDVSTQQRLQPGLSGISR